MKDYRQQEQGNILKLIQNENLRQFLTKLFADFNFYSDSLSISAFYDNLANQHLWQYSATDIGVVQRLTRFMKFHKDTQPFIVALLCVQFQKSPDVLLQELSPLLREVDFDKSTIQNFMQNNVSVKFPVGTLPVNFVHNARKQKPCEDVSIFLPDIILGQYNSLRSSTTQLPDLILSVQKPLLSSAQQICQFKAPIPCKCQNCAATAVDSLIKLINRLKGADNFMSRLNYAIETQLLFDGCRCAFKVLSANFQYHRDFTLLKDLDKTKNQDLIRRNVGDSLFPYIDVTLFINYRSKSYELIHAPQNQLVMIGRPELNEGNQSVLVNKLRDEYGVTNIYTAPHQIVQQIERDMRCEIRQCRILNPYYPFLLISECFNCMCTTSCMLRNVQLKQCPRLYIQYSNQSQYGVFCDTLIPEGQFIAEYPGLVHTDSQAENIGYFQDSIRCSYLFDHNLDQLFIDENNEGLSTDAARVGNVARFFNHSNKPNMEKKFVFWDDEGLTPYGQFGVCHICLFAACNIWPGTELCFDYEYKECPELSRLYPWAFQKKE